MKTHSTFAPPEYIRVDSLPEAWQQEFPGWLRGQTCPAIWSEVDVDEKRARCAYRWDYERWLAAFRLREVAMPLD